MKKNLIIFSSLILCFIEVASCENYNNLVENSETAASTENAIHLNPNSEYIAIFGDIQFYTNYGHIDYYQKSIDWLLQQKKNGYNINCVLHTGDVTMTNALSQWDCFYRVNCQLVQKIPYYSMIGDHDYTWESGIIHDRNSTLFNNYLHFPKSKQNVVDWYEPGHMENIVVENFIHGEPYYLLILEFGPRKEVVEWAASYVKNHSDNYFVLLNHEYLEMGGGRRTKGLKCKSRLRNTSYTTPDELWETLIKCNDNISCVLCGHVGGLYNLTIDINDFGREVPQIQHNIQSSSYRYDNWLMLWEFPLEKDSVNVSIINTRTQEFFYSKCLFQFRYRYPIYEGSR